MPNRIVLNEMSYFGAGACEVLPEEIVARGFKKVFLVTDNDLIRFGVAAQVTALLEKRGIPYVVFSDLKQNPTVENVKAGVAAFAAAQADVIVALGGGSPIDTAKAIGIVTRNPEFADVVSLEGVAATKNRSVPIIAIPTTAGTAAEVTVNYVITDTKNVKKMVCIDAKDIPVLSIVDAALMVSMPAGLTAATGMDALTHAIEGFITRGAWTMSDMFALQAIELIAKYLPRAVKNGKDTEAREQMALGQYIAGMGFSNVGLGLVHGMAHPLGAFYDIPHGVANALLLPSVMEYNMPAAIAKYGRIATAMGIDVTGMDEKSAAQAAVKAVKNLAIEVGIPQNLAPLGVKAEDLQRLSQSAYADVCTPGNPRETSVADILAIYNSLM